MEIPKVQNNILQRLIQLVPHENNMELPPKVFIDMEGEFIEFVPNEKLVVRFPNKDRYMNPFGFMQGGVLVAAMDNTISPLSYASAPPSITKEIKTKFKRPVKRVEEYVDVVASIVEKASSFILLKAEVLNEKGKLVANSLANCVYIKGVRNK